MSERIGETVGKDVGTHAQGLLALFFGIVVYPLIFPTIAQVTFVGVEHH